MWWRSVVVVTRFVGHVIALFPLGGLRLSGVVQAMSVVRGTILHVLLLQMDGRRMSDNLMA